MKLLLDGGGVMLIVLLLAACICVHLLNVCFCYCVVACSAYWLVCFLVWWVLVVLIFVCSVCLCLLCTIGWFSDLVWFGFALRWYLEYVRLLLFVFDCCVWVWFVFVSLGFLV